MNIIYKNNHVISVEQFISLLQRSRLGERRPIENKTCLNGMLDNSNLTITAWDENKLVGIARCMTDFHYACYLSDLAVDEDYQRLGIGKILQNKVKENLQDTCKLILISAPNANDYYKHIGYRQNPRCWVLEGQETLS